MELTKTIFKQTEVGLIPDNWEVKTLGEISIRIGDGIHSTPIYTEGGEFYFVNGNNLVKGKIEFDNDTKTVNESEFKKHGRELNYKTILLSINGTIGNTAFYNGEKIVLGKSAAYIGLKDSFSKKFIYYLLQTNQVKLFFEANLTGSTIKNLGLNTIRNTNLPIPPPTEQKIIASALSDIDALINGLSKLISKKKDIKQGTMKQLLTSPNKGGKSLTGFSKVWGSIELQYLCDIIGGGTPSTRVTAFWNGDVNWFTPTEIGKQKYISDSVRKITSDGMKSCSANILPKGTILMTSRASIGDLAILQTEACTNQGFQSLIPKDMRDSEFLYHLMSMKKTELLALSSGSTFLEISPKKVKTLFVEVPQDIDERVSIAQILSDMDIEIETLEVKKQKYLNIKQGMMQELLTGKTRLV